VKSVPVKSLSGATTLMKYAPRTSAPRIFELRTGGSVRSFRNVVLSAAHFRWR
jgi:hypothetical protein